MTPLMWVAALVVVGLVALALEVFVPSGGVLGFLSVVALVAGVALAFVEQGPWFGTAVLAVTCLAVPLVLGVAFRVFPETPLGRRVLPPPPRPARRPSSVGWSIER
jgi:membrane-bound ClpP family serine protease